MRDKMNMPMAMPKMAPIRGPAEEFGEESSRRERFRGEGQEIMSREVLWIQIDVKLLILSNSTHPNRYFVAMLLLEGSQIIL